MKNTKLLLGIIAILTLVIIVGVVFIVSLLSKDETEPPEPSENIGQKYETEDNEPANTSDTPDKSDENESAHSSDEREPTGTDTAVTETQPAETQPAVFLSYLEKVQNPGEPIYSGPGYEYNYVNTVGAAGVFTIVEEATDSRGNLWGRLKSGAGWIDLTHNRKYFAFISAGLAGSTEQGNLFYSDTNDEYSCRIAITANTNLNFEFYEVFGNPRTITTGHLNAGEVFVIQLSFPGDLTTFGITATNSSGETQRFNFYQSGMDGSLKVVSVS